MWENPDLGGRKSGPLKGIYRVVLGDHSRVI